MKIIISINQKFMEYSHKELIKLIKQKSKYTEGFEISIDYDNKKHLTYLNELVFECKKIITTYKFMVTVNYHSRNK